MARDLSHYQALGVDGSRARKGCVMYCPKCGKPVGDSDVFCRSCGLRLSAENLASVSLESPSDTAVNAPVEKSAEPTSASVPATAIIARVQGKVKWFNNAKGYGFIGAQNLPDVFAHFSQFAKGASGTLQDGDLVEFEVGQGKLGPMAMEITKLGEATKTSASVQDVGHLDTLSGIEFEGLIARLLERMGFTAETTKASGDGGIDIVATLDNPLTGGRYLIQCKRYAPDSLVGAPTVREFYGAVTADRGAAKGILITTSGYTSQAHDFAAGLPIELIGRDRLQLLLDQHGLFKRDFCLPAQPEERARELVALAGKMREQSRNAEAVKLLREASQLQPDNPYVWFHLGLSYHSVGLHDEQIAAMREAVQLKPDFAEAWQWLGSGLRKVGNLDAATDALKQGLAIQPDNFHILHELGLLCRDKGDHIGALSAFSKAVKIKPDDVNGWFQVGVSSNNLKEYTEACHAFQEVLRINPDHVESWELLFWVYRNLRDKPRMLQAHSRLEQLAPAKAREYRRYL